MSGAQQENPGPTLSLPIEPPLTGPDGGTFSSLNLKEPTAGQKRTAYEQLRNGSNPASVALYEIHFISGVAGIPIAVVEKLPLTTINLAMNYLDFFVEVGRKTGWR